MTLRRWSLPTLAVLCAASVAIILITRLAIGPADLYEKDQPKTLAYTADVLLHGRWALPRDVIYQPATKPPLYNWIAAIVMKLTGSWSELAMKSPSVIGAVGVGAMLLFLPWHERLARDSMHERNDHAAKWAVGLLACAIWFVYGIEPRHGSVMRLMFLARPDMLQAFFLTAVWLAATRALLPLPLAGGGRGVGYSNRTGTDDSQSDSDQASASPPSLTLPRKREREPEAVLFWSAVAGAILTKGPLALLAIVYAAIAAKLLTGSWRSIRRLHPILGLAFTIFAVGTWFFFAWRTDPDHVRYVMLGAEIVNRVTNATPEGIEKPVYFAAMWFVTKGGPFSLLAIAMAGVALLKRRSIDPLTLGATLWLVVLLVGLSLPAGKRIDYLLPTFAPAAWLAARAVLMIIERLRLPIAIAGMLPLAASLVLARAHLTKFHESQSPLSDRAVAFTRQIRERVKDDESLLVLVRGKHPLTTLLHRHQGSALVLADLQHARWIVVPLTESMADPVLRSDLLPMGFETIEDRPLAVLGLFDMQSTSRPTLEELIATQRSVGEWTRDENPYHSAGTVWREAASDH